MVPGTDLGLEPGGAQRTHQGLVGEGGGFFPAEPPRVGALSLWGGRVAIGSEEQISQVKMGMSLRGAVHVNVDEARPGPRMGERQARLLLCLTQGRVPRCFTGFEVPPRL